MDWYIYNKLLLNKNKEYRSLKIFNRIFKGLQKTPSLLKEKVKESPSIPSKSSFTFFLKEFFEGFEG